VLISAQYLRAFAAIAVTLFHFRETFQSAGGPPWVAALVDWGHGGVPIFFVLAGFIMVWTTRLKADPVRFLWNRLVRIYGGFLPIALAFLWFKAMTTGVDYWVPGGLDLPGSLALTEPDAARLLIYPAWSLPYELMFYLAFAACLLAPRAWFFPICALCVGVFAILQLSTGLHVVDDPVFLSPINLCFLIGIAVGYCVVKGFHQRPAVFSTALLVAVGCNLLGVIRAEDTSKWLEVVSFGLGTGALLICLVRLENDGKVPHWKWLKRFGDASFAIYLIHAPLTFVWQTQGVTPYVAYHFGPYAYLGGHVAVVILVSLLYFKLIEKPLNKLGRQLFDRLAHILHSSRNASDNPLP
jgi:exopolysaccharide production protein ExoZ